MEDIENRIAYLEQQIEIMEQDLYKNIPSAFDNILKELADELNDKFQMAAGPFEDVYKIIAKLYSIVPSFWREQ